MAKDCPRCDLANPDSAERCDCGYDFGSGTVKESYLAPQEQGARARLTPGDIAIAIFLPVVGIIMGMSRLRRHRPTARKMLLVSGGMFVAQLVLHILTWRSR